jgi:hypothetical protein
MFNIAPLALERNFVWRDIEYVVSADSANGTGSMTAGHMLGIYKDTTTSNYTTSQSCITAVDRYVWNVVLSQNSKTAQSYVQWWGTDSAANTTTLEGNVSASCSGARQILLGTNAGSTYTEGQYYVVHGFSNSTVGANVQPVDSALFLSNLSTTAGALYFGSNGTVPIHPKWMGQFTVGSTLSATDAASNVGTGANLLPESFASSILTNTGGTSQWQWPLPQFYY